MQLVSRRKFCLAAPQAVLMYTYVRRMYHTRLIDTYLPTYPFENVDLRLRRYCQVREALVPRVLTLFLLNNSFSFNFEPMALLFLLLQRWLSSNYSGGSSSCYVWRCCNVLQFPSQLGVKVQVASRTDSRRKQTSAHSLNSKMRN